MALQAETGIGTTSWEPGAIHELADPAAGEAWFLVLSQPSRRGTVRVRRLTPSAEDGAEAVLQLNSAWLEAPVGRALCLADEPEVEWPVSRLGARKAGMTAAGLDGLLRELVGREVTRYWQLTHPQRDLDFRSSPVPVSGKVIGEAEIRALVEASLDGWLTAGRFNTQFQRRLAQVLGVRHVLTTNSGSSANLLALAALTSPLLGERALRPGDEVITAAAGFPTTVNPVLLYGLTPVFVDVHIPTYNVTVEAVAEAIGPRTRAIMLAHTLGNPYDVAAISALARQNGLWLVEDCCDALGSQVGGQGVGTFGDVGTLSFYPAHHITMGEGGAVFCSQGPIKRALESIRDWGRDCWCEPGKENTCGKRFDWQLGRLPRGYDHKYTYSHLGYNLKITDMQAAVGLAQLERLPEFVRRRKANFAYLRRRLDPLQGYFVLPEATPGSDPAWFGFPLLLRETAPVDRDRLLRRLEARRVATRLLFAGNLTQQPYMLGRSYRQVGELANTNRIMNQVLWLGVFPGLNEAMLDYVVESLEASVTTGATVA